jgi:hypothetical protein
MAHLSYASERRRLTRYMMIVINMQENMMIVM